VISEPKWLIGSAINRHVHLDTCVTDGVFTQASDGCCAKFPITAADLATLTERVRGRVVRWFRMQGADRPQEVRLQGRSAPTRKIRP
jgi:hypothetical protein